jgi:hypothetical protein
VNGGRGPSASIRRRHAVPAAAPGRQRPPTPRVSSLAFEEHPPEGPALPSGRPAPTPPSLLAASPGGGAAGPHESPSRASSDESGANTAGTGRGGARRPKGRRHAPGNEPPRGSCREAHWRTARSTIGTQPQGERRPRRMPREDHRIVSGRLVRLGERPALDRAGGDQGVRSRSRTGPRSVSPRGDRSGHRLDGQYRRPPRGLTRRGS